MSSQAHDLHRALLRPAIIHILRAQGFHSTKPSVLDTLVNLAERHILLLASTTSQHAWSSHNDPVPTITDLRMALSDCGVLIPLTDPSEEAWKEYMRRPLPEMAQAPKGAEERVQAAKRKRDEEDTRDVREFTSWYDSAAYKEIKRVAGIIPDPNTTGISVGVGGSVVQGDDFLTTLKKKQNKAGGDHDARLQGTVLGRVGDDREVLVEGGPVQRIRDWKPPRVEEKAPVQNGSAKPAEKSSDAVVDTTIQEIAAAS